MSDFNSAWWKWRWAVDHAESLKADITRGTEDGSGQPFLSTAQKYHPKRHCFVVTVDSLEDRPVQWGLRLGDLIHNYRSALDHTAWALVGRGTTPNLTDGQRRNVYFPFADSPEWFRKNIARYLPGVRAADIALVRRYQPYQRRNRRVMALSLGNLRDFSDEDKHRTVQPVWARPRHGDYRFTVRQDCSITRIGYPRRGPLRLSVGTELAYVYVRRTGPNPDIQVKGQIAADITIGDNVWLDAWCHVTSLVIANLLLSLAPPPFNLTDVPGWDDRGNHPS